MKLATGIGTLTRFTMTFVPGSVMSLPPSLDAVIIAVEDIRALMNNHPVLVDVREMVDRDTAEKAGMFYRKL